MRTLGLAAGLAVLLGAGSNSAVGQEGSSLPGGASSLQETFENWQVACVVNGSTRQCALSQEHRQHDGRRVLGINLVPMQSGTMEGALVLPFGLNLDAGVTLTVNERPLAEGLRFSTCLPAGCVVPFTLDDAALGSLRSGEALVLTAIIEDTRSPLTFSVPLMGFSAALERTIALLE